MEDEFSTKQFDADKLEKILPQIDITSYSIITIIHQTNCLKSQHAYLSIMANIKPFLGANNSIDECLPRDLPCDHTTPYRQDKIGS